METTQAVGSLALFGTMFVLNQDAAIGCAFGSVFFLLSAKQYIIAARAVYTVISAGFGYGLGIGIGGDWTMMSAILGSAGAIVILDGMSKGAEPTAFLKWVLDVIRGRR